jgi:5'-nucleotidase
VPVTVSPRPSRRGSLGVALFALLGLVIPAGVFAAKPPAPPPVNIQILNASDWHGQIDPLGPPPIGSAWSIAARWDEDRLAYPTLTVAAGDDFGATPPLSAFFDEIPSVLTQRMMGVQIGTFGNHNFDRGIAHLQEMINLAAAPTDADHPGTPYRYVAANLSNMSANLTGVEPFAMTNVGGAKVAVIGIVNEEAPGLVTPGNFGTMLPTDGVAAANKWAAKARQAGANAVIVITHKGVRGTDIAGNFFGELVDFAQDVDPNLIDVIIGDHTDIQFNGVINGIRVHENRSKGATYTKTLINTQVRKGGTVIGVPTVEFVTPTAPARTSAQLVAAECPDPAAGTPAQYCDEEILEVLVPYREELAVLLDPKIATATATFVRGGNIERRQEVALGNLVAEGMRWFQATDFAFINGGGLRSPLPSSYTPLDPSLDRSLTDGDPADLVLGDVYSVLPFTNTVLKRTITGAQLWEALENGVSRIDAAGNSGDGRFPQVAGFEFTFNYDNLSGCTGTSGAANWVCVPSRVTSVTRPDGTPIPADGTVYTLAIPSFTNQGGDSYRVFLNNPQTGENEVLDAIVMTEYIEFLGSGGFPELDPADWVDGRIVKCGTAHPCS